MPKPNLNKLSSLNFSDSPIDELTQLAKLESELAKKDDIHELENTVLNLSDYLKTVQMVINHTFDHHVWVKAEVRNLSSKGGHYYFELAEKDEDGKVIASCRGNLWRFKAERVLNKFARVTGSQLTRDLTLLLKVSATLHPQYGFSLNIEDIDPSYTLGDLAKQYNAMVDRLTGEGLINANKQLPTPFDIENVIVIAPEKAAGLGDFKAEADKLAVHQACNFHYHYATFQGNHAPAEIRQAINKGVTKFSKSHNKLPDLIVIIRGGGAVGDLAYLNDYELAALIAEQKIPVWVGIGHERDKVILDEVAHTSFDTPSKVISGIMNHLRSLVSNTLSYIDSIERISKMHVTQANNVNQQLLNNIHASSMASLTHKQKETTFAMHSIKQNTQRIIKQSKQNTKLQINSINTQSDKLLVLANNKTKAYYNSVHHTAQKQIQQAKKDTTHLRDLILLQHPANVLKNGYALVTDLQDNNVLTSVSHLHPKQNVKLTLKDGEVIAEITKHID